MDGRIKSGKVIRAGDDNILHTRVPQAVELGRPELGALIFAYPHAQYILLAIQSLAAHRLFRWSGCELDSRPQPQCRSGQYHAGSGNCCSVRGPAPHDRGCHYRWPGWIERMERTGLTRSMSKKNVPLIIRHVNAFWGA